MKRSISILLLVAMVLSLFGCAVPDQDILQSTPKNERTTSTTTTPTTTTQTTTTPTTSAPTTPTQTAQTVPVDSSFEVHFIDVGQADAALVLCDGRAMLIDGGNAEDSSLLYSYLKKHGIAHLDYVIGTHAHEDHIGGIAGALNYATAGVVLCPVTSYDSKAFQNFAKTVNSQGVSITVPSAGETFQLGSASCRILAANTSSDANNTSIVLRIVYGKTSFLFTGDAERETEQAILNSGQTLQSTVLKVGHHGSDTSTSYVWLREIMPEYAVISVGAKNSYGHPTEEVLSRLRDADVKTFRTDMQGDIVCVSDGERVTFTVGRNAEADTFGGIGGNSTQRTQATTKRTEPATVPPGVSYILNTNSKKFHYPYCGSAARISAKNRRDYTGTREELISWGYSPCGNCDP